MNVIPSEGKARVQHKNGRGRVMKRYRPEQNHAETGADQDYDCSMHCAEISQHLGW